MSLSYLRERLKELDSQRIRASQYAQSRGMDYDAYFNWAGLISRQLEVRHQMSERYDTIARFSSDTEQLEAELFEVQNKISLMPSRKATPKEIHDAIASLGR